MSDRVGNSKCHNRNLRSKAAIHGGTKTLEVAGCGFLRACICLYLRGRVSFLALSI